MSHCIVLTTTASAEEADKIANVLVENRVVACVQIFPIVSIYRWQGKVERENELRLTIKTTNELYPRVENLIKENHSYEVPQIVKVPITDGLREYLDWVSEETG